MIYTKMTKAALKLCFEAHKAQQDKSGIPYILKRNIAFLLCLLMILSCFVGCSASKNKSSNANLAFTSVQKQYSVSFLDHDSSEIISMNQEDAKQFEEFVSSVSLEYPYSELYGVNECYDRIFTYSSVSKHERSALDNNGKLTAEHLFELVKENNQHFNEDKKNDMGFYKDAEDDFLLSLCKLIVYCGVIDDEEFTAYLYPTEPSLWEILLDPTGMAYRTIYEKGKGYLSQAEHDDFMLQIADQFGSMEENSSQ